MSQIVNWEYYSSLFGKVSKNDFDRVEKQAEKAVCRVIGPIRWANITEETYGYEHLKDCICNTMNKLMEQEVSGIGKGISSASNDGYSESYVIQTESQAREELNSSIRAWLSGTGLVGAY
jgi:hypothetical protein